VDALSAPLTEFLANYWDDLPVRPEMRSHRMLEKRVDCLRGFALYAIQDVWQMNVDYQFMWRDSIDRIPYYNRYMAIKYLEILRRTVRPDLIIPDMRAKGGWSPRKTLALLYPSDAEILGNKERNGPEDVALTEMTAKLARAHLRDMGVVVSMFQLQVLLCEYKEALAGGYYPGASLDEELDYMKLCSIKSANDRVLQARAEIFRPEHLGEISGWDGIRKEKYQEWK